MFDEWDPFGEFKRIQHEIFHALAPFEERVRVRPAFANVYETETGVIAEFELPGVDKKDIKINLTPTDVEVKVERKEEKEEKTKRFYKHEARALSFYRKIAFPVEVVTEKAKATYRNGILRVEAPKVKTAKKSVKTLTVE